jgi:hypothetical protein
MSALLLLATPTGPWRICCFCRRWIYVFTDEHRYRWDWSDRGRLVKLSALRFGTCGPSGFIRKASAGCSSWERPSKASGKQLEAFVRAVDSPIVQ